MFEIKIKEHSTGETIEVISSASLHSAEKIDRGININLNHDKYYTEIEEAKP